MGEQGDETRYSTVAHGPEHGLERLIFFSDAVFAIAITLLVIEIHVPHLPMGSAETDYWIALVNLTPQFLGFFISFFVIGTFWAAHHRTLALAARHDAKLTTPNLMLLSTIALMPFFTAFTSGNPTARVPAFCYCLWLLVTAIGNRWLQQIATSPPIVSPEAPADRIALIRTRGTAVILGAASAVAVSLLVPVLGQVALMSIPLWRLLLSRAGGSKA